MSDGPRSHRLKDRAGSTTLGHLLGLKDVSQRTRIDGVGRYIGLTEDHCEHLRREEAGFENFENATDLLPTDLELEAAGYSSVEKDLDLWPMTIIIGAQIGTVSPRLEPWRDRVKAYVDSSLGVLLKSNADGLSSGAVTKKEARETYILRDRLVADIQSWALQGLRDEKLSLARYVGGASGFTPRTDPAENRHFHLNSIYNRDSEHLRVMMDVREGKPGSFTIRKEIHNFPKKDSLQEYIDRVGQSSLVTHGTPAMDTSSLTEMDMPESRDVEAVREPRVLVSSLFFNKPNETDMDPFVLKYYTDKGWDWDGAIPDIEVSEAELALLVGQIGDRAKRGLIRMARDQKPKVRQVTNHFTRTVNVPVLDEKDWTLKNTDIEVHETTKYVDEYEMKLGREPGDPGTAVRFFTAAPRDIGTITNARTFLVWCTRCHEWTEHVRDVLDYHAAGLNTQFSLRGTVIKTFLSGKTGDYRCTTCGSHSDVRVLRFRYKEMRKFGVNEDGKQVWWDVTAVVRTGSLGFIEDLLRLRPDVRELVNRNVKNALATNPSAFWVKRPVPSHVREADNKREVDAMMRDLLARSGF